MGANQYTKIFKFKSIHDKKEVKKLAKNKLIDARYALRALILLMRNRGISQKQVALALETNRKSVAFWEERYNKEGIKGLFDKPGRGRKPSFSPL
jgi:transposase